MKRNFLLAATALIVLCSGVLFAGFKSHAPRTEQLQKRINELEAELKRLKADAPVATIKKFESDKDLSNFIVQNHNAPDFNYTTVAIDGPTLMKTLTDLGAAKYKDTVFVSIVLNSNGRELMLSNLKSRICNTGFCCPPRCRYEPFGLAELPATLPQQNNANKQPAAELHPVEQ